MKIRKLKENPHTCGLLCGTIAALKTAREISASVEDATEFRRRCADAILALGNQLLVEYVEPLYEPEEKLFVVDYDVKRSGVHHMTVTAKDKAEAKAEAEKELRGFAESWFNARETEFVAADVVDAKEVPNG